MDFSVEVLVGSPQTEHTTTFAFFLYLGFVTKIFWLFTACVCVCD